MRKSTRNRAIAYLLTINLIGGLLVPSLVNAMASETRVLLCTSQGYQWVTVETQQEISITDDTRSVLHCGYCLSTNDDLSESVQANDSVIFSLLADQLLIKTEHEALKNLFLTAAQPRAPPFFV